MARDLLRSVFESLGARKVRTILLMFGPALGVAAIVGVIGVSESARGEVAAALRALGSDLIVVEATAPANANDAASAHRLPAGAVNRARRVPATTSAAQITALPELGVQTSPLDDAPAPAAQVHAVGEGLTEVLGLSAATGRMLNAFDRRTAAPTALVGSQLAKRMAVVVGQPRTIMINEEAFAVVGTLQPVPVAPELDQAVLVTGPAAARFTDDLRATSVYVRVEQDRVEAAVDLLPVAVTYGGVGSLRVLSPTTLLAAGAEMDQTLRATVLALGALTLIVGGFAIGNVMSITVLQRAPEIGIRRAIGHTRSLIGWQFLLEATFVGLLGGALGIALGSAATAMIAERQRWLIVLDPGVIVGAALLAAVVSAAGGALPALHAARMEPMRTLRVR